MTWWPIVTGTLAAFCTGVGVTLLLIDRWYRITTEFSDQLDVTTMPEYCGEPWRGVIPDPAVRDKIVLTVLVTNGSKQRIKLDRWELSGVPLERYPDMGIGFDVPIDEKRQVALTIKPDWTAWRQSVVSSGIRTPSFRASVSIDRRTRIYPIMFRTATINVKVETIMQNAAKPSAEPRPSLDMRYTGGPSSGTP